MRLLLSWLLPLSALLITACGDDEDSPTPGTDTELGTVITADQPITVTLSEASDTVLYQFVTNEVGVIEVVARGDFSGLRVSLRDIQKDSLLIGNALVDADEMLEAGPVPVGAYQIILNTLLLTSDASDLELTYRLDPTDSYELNQTSRNPTDIEVNQLYTAYLRDRNDEDWFSFELTESSFVDIVAEFPEELFGAKPELLDSARAVVDQEKSREGIYRPAKRILPPGTYYLGFSASNSSQAAYTFSVNTEVAPDVAGGDNLADAYLLSSGETVNSLLASEGEKRFFRLNTPRCGVIGVTVRSVPKGMRMTAEIYNRQDESARVAYTSDGEGEVLTLYYGPDLFDDDSEEYFLMLEAGYNEASQTPFEVTYQLDTSDVYECNNTLAEPTPIAPGQTLEASIFTSSDKDYYEFKLEKPGVITATVEGVPDGINRMYLGVFTRQDVGSLLDYGVAEQGNRLSVTAGPLDIGTYYLVVSTSDPRFSSSSGNSGSSNTYQLSIEPNYDDAFELNDNIGEAKDITSYIDSAAVTAYLLADNIGNDNDDVDYFKFRLEGDGDQTLRFTLTSVSETNTPTYLELYPSKEERYNTDLFSIYESQGQEVKYEITLSPQEDYYYLKVRNQYKSFNPYSVLIEVVP